MKKILTTPIKDEDLKDINIGDIIYLTGTIVKDHGNNKYEMISIGPTTSMRMEKFEKEFIEETGVKLIVGKGGMGKNTEEGCRENKALHLVYPAGNAVYAADKVEYIKAYIT
ncbi:fumarate hydratase C-terminal domain-containing protein [Sedimentibacter hydroxybenzoicus DSM 7310]|uniref:L(+)-tartrate dehydratase subunit beta n=1 Tax=Sedimentibacter hydroxybenzoicus DSM 7310 TaxID=1123245 RepID=A0A974BN19_SEDHY|nr:fumarate hydratase C-terminal domain-containing protein [Sedimentibacter hydroxybenzoicus DSM 7310]